jgi:DNA helicase-2/ATP-dependent DNA helicase PcrA
MRWQNTNPDLGRWLTQVRKNLIEGTQIDFAAQNLPSRTSRFPFDYNEILKVSSKRHRDCPKESIAVIQLSVPAQAHSLAHRIGGSFRSSDEVEMKDLMHFASIIDSRDRYEQILALLDLCSDCLVGVTADITSRIAEQLKSKTFSISNRIKNYRGLHFKVQTYLEYGERKTLAEILTLLHDIAHGKIVRQLWYDLREVIDTYCELPSGLLSEIVNKRITFKSNFGHTKGNIKSVERILLIKGLEFDNTIIYNANGFKTAKELYVALTRARNSMAIFSNTESIRHDRPVL